MSEPSYGHVQLFRVHFDDLDLMGVVHNARYPLIVERALTEYWTERGWSLDAERSAFEDVFLAVREFNVNYLRPITTVGQAAVHFWVERIGRTSVGYGFRVLSADLRVVYAEGTRSQVRLDPATFRPAPLSIALRAAAERLCRPIAA